MFKPDRSQGTQSSLAMVPQSKMAGGGSNIVLNEEVLAFYQECLEDVSKSYTDALHTTNPEQVLLTLIQEHGWQAVQDDFGTKAYRALKYPLSPTAGAEYRVTVVIPKTDPVLHIDMRIWIPRPTSGAGQSGSRRRPWN